MSIISGLLIAERRAVVLSLEQHEPLEQHSIICLKVKRGGRAVEFLNLKGILVR